MQHDMFMVLRGDLGDRLLAKLLGRSATSVRMYEFYLLLDMNAKTMRQELLRLGITNIDAACERLARSAASGGVLSLWRFGAKQWP